MSLSIQARLGRARRAIALGAVAMLASALVPFTPVAAGTSLPLVTVTGVASNNSSVVVSFNAVAGAADYRVYDTANPMTVKYAGLAPGTTSPLTSIEWNAVEDNSPHTLVVQAVNELGPFPQNNLMSFGDTAIYPPPGMMGLGANEGMTMDGKTSINGQGPYTNVPSVIAQSAPFTAQASPTHVPIPSMIGSSQNFLDTFADSEGSTLQSVTPQLGMTTFEINHGTAQDAFILDQNNDDTCSHMLFDTGHFMNVVCDGPIPTKYNQSMLHQMYASSAYTPKQTASLSSGQMFHFTVEVDSHVDLGTTVPIPDGRWLELKFSPANDPISNFGSKTGGPNATKQMIDVLIQNNTCSVSVSQKGAPNFFMLCNRNSNGVGLDQRTRWDIFFTMTHIAVFENGHLDGQGDFPNNGLTFSTFKSYAASYLFRSGQENTALQPECRLGLEPQWCNSTIYSDERHWDNVGVEVLPASAVPPNDSFGTLTSLINLPVSVPPKS